MRIVFKRVMLSVVLWGAGLAGCQSSSTLPDGKPPVAEPPGNSVPTAPDIALVTLSDLQEPGKATLFVHFKAESIDANGNPVSYRFTWFRNGADREYPTGQTNAILSWPEDGTVRLADEHRIEQWMVVVTPHDGFAEGATAFAVTNVDLVHPCDPSSAAMDYVDCEGRNKFTIASAEPWVPGDPAPGFVAAMLTKNLTFASAGGAYHRFLNFLNLAALRNFDATPGTDPDHDAETYLYRPTTAPTGPYSGADATVGAGGYDPEVLLAYCYEVPLIGTACVRGQIYDIDWEVGQHILGFLPENVSILTTDVEMQPDGSATYAVSVSITSSTFDMLAEPPTDATLVDVSDSLDGYLPENDLSAYVKAHGRATVNYAILSFTGSLPAEAVAAGQKFELLLRSVDVGTVTLEAKTGPYCNNNLGTTETPFAGATHQTDSSKRPFRASGGVGVPNHPGLVSDTVTGMQGVSYAEVHRGPEAAGANAYYPRSLGSPNNIFPRTTSQHFGGSGAGRDRIGVNTSPYQYLDMDGTRNDRFSDNPNNCRRPADTCTLNFEAHGMALDGAPTWNGPSAACEGSATQGPISNNSDDASYKISELVLGIYPRLLLR